MRWQGFYRSWVMVPNGWSQTRLENIAKIRSGSTPLRAKQDLYFSEDGTPWVKTLDLNNSEIIVTDERITELALKETSCSILPANTVLVAMYGGFNQIGRTGLLTQPSAINQALSGLVLDLERAEPKYVLDYLNGNVGQWKKFAASSRKDPNITRQDVCSFEILLPPLIEQQKIAKILSTWDKAISTTERLIDNSTQQKKALMQQLLTGKKRLLSTNSGFSVRDGFAKSKLGELPDDWNLSLISNFYWFQEGPGVRKHQFTETGVKLLNGTNIQKSRVDLTTTKTHISEDEAYGGYKHFLADSGDLIIACSGISVDRFDEKIAFLEDRHLPLCMNTSTMRFKVKKDVKASLEFLRYFMMSPLFKNQIRRQITGSAQLNFGPSHVEKCYIALPSYDEQQRIAAVLINADKEIDLLEQQLADLQQEKKALMQVLLTGKKRVKLND